jgi:hypothetical protein
MEALLWWMESEWPWIFGKVRYCISIDARVHLIIISFDRILESVARPFPAPRFDRRLMLL